MDFPWFLPPTSHHFCSVAPAGCDPGPFHQNHRLQPPELLAATRKVAEGVVVVLGSKWINWIHVCWIPSGKRLQFAIENGHLSLIHPIKMVIF